MTPSKLFSHWHNFQETLLLVMGKGGEGQSTLAANQGDQRGPGHSMMQGGGGGSNLSCQLSAAGATATTQSHDLMVWWYYNLILCWYDGVLV